MIEVEAKIKISNPDYFRNKIKKFARFAGKKRKIDSYYTLGEADSYPKRSLRIRRLDGHYEVNIKKRISYIKGVHAKREIELRSIEKNSLPAFLDILKDFGFKKWLVKEKESEIYRIKENFNVEINNVRKLGWFIEVEKLSDAKGIERARMEVVNFIKQLGVSEKNIIKDGYTKMLWDKRAGKPINIRAG